MRLQKLINQKSLEEFGEVSIGQIKKRFAGGMAFLDAAKKLLKNKTAEGNWNIIVYTNTYNAARRIGEVFLLLNGYRAKINEHHKTVIEASKLIMNNPKMNNMFARLDKMRKNRNKIEYDTETLDVSTSTIEQSIEDVQNFANEVKKAISKKDKQRKLM
jgi:uncharacterized protein (UPF0332 family)